MPEAAQQNIATILLMDKIRGVFSPSAPIDSVALFSGRRTQVNHVLGAVLQKGQHVVLYGERGVGKTSLANILSELTRSHGFTGLNSGTINCDVQDTFASLWQKVLRDLHVVQKATDGWLKTHSTEEKITLDKLIGENITPDDVRRVLAELKDRSIIIIDELDRLEDQSAKRLLADTIKTLSDHAAGTTLVLVGVADSLADLITEHLSIERALVQVRMPRMSREELIEILDKGFEKIGMTIESAVKMRIAVLSQGLPAYTHLLGLHAALNAATDARRAVSTVDVQAAVREAVEKVQHSVLQDYHRATASLKTKNLYATVLLACALAKTDEIGQFAAADIKEPLSRLLRKAIGVPQFARHIAEFCEARRGPVLQRLGSFRRYRFRFRNPMLQPFVILNGLAKGLIDDATFRSFVDNPAPVDA